MKVNCPNCMASLIYDVASGKMECKFCGCLFELEDVADQEEKEEAMRTVVRLWNIGKAIRMDPGE